MNTVNLHNSMANRFRRLFASGGITRHNAAQEIDPAYGYDSCHPAPATAYLFSDNSTAWVEVDTGRTYISVSVPGKYEQARAREQEARDILEAHCKAQGITLDELRAQIFNK